MITTFTCNPFHLLHLLTTFGSIEQYGWKFVFVNLERRSHVKQEVSRSRVILLWVTTIEGIDKTDSQSILRVSLSLGRGGIGRWEVTPKTGDGAVRRAHALWNSHSTHGNFCGYDLISHPAVLWHHTATLRPRTAALGQPQNALRCCRGFHTVLLHVPHKVIRNPGYVHFRTAPIWCCRLCRPLIPRRPTQANYICYDVLRYVEWICTFSKQNYNMCHCGKVFFPWLFFHVYIESLNPTKHIRPHTIEPKPLQLKSHPRNPNPRLQSHTTINEQKGENSIKNNLGKNIKPHCVLIVLNCAKN